MKEKKGLTPLKFLCWENLKSHTLCPYNNNYNETGKAVKILIYLP